ncbi:exo-alpha-sialidase [Verrucomicrobiota bacterium]
MMTCGSEDGVFEMQDLFDSDPHKRIPKIMAATDGTVLAFTRSGGLMRRSEDAGVTWGPVQEMESGGGNVVIDDNTGDVLIVRPSTSELWRSSDGGKTWVKQSIKVLPNAMGHGVPDNAPASGNCSESGIALRYGEHKGRLLVPVRVQPPNGDNAQEYWAYGYNAGLYSDDGGKTWQVSEPVQSGTGEGALAELSDGRIYYNSRCHMAVDARRRIAWSHDGGHRWVDWHVCDTLREVGEPFYFQYGTRSSYGCNCGLVRIPDEASNGHDILLFSTPDNPGGTRVRMTVWASFDGAATWSVKRLVYGGPSAYSSMTADTRGTIYLLFERGRSANLRCDIDHHKISLARFNLAWVLNGGCMAGRDEHAGFQG